jgi:hypothetical protein
MDNFEYVNKWNKRELNKFKREDFEDVHANYLTIQFLTTIGLPDSAAPFLAFDRKELKTIKAIYNTDEAADNFLIDIGFDGAGDPICIDTENNCEIVALDHEDNFNKRFANSSVKELFAFLTIYKESGESLIKLRGEDAFIDSNFTDEEVEELIGKLKSVDARALENNETFWSLEIGMLIANRDAG